MAQKSSSRVIEAPQGVRPQSATPAATERLTAPLVRGKVPGPASQRALARQDARESNARSYPRNLPIALRRGDGSYVEDLDGNVFIDFLMSAGVLALGHSHPEVVAVVQRQVPLLITALDFPTEPKDEFTSVVMSLLPESMRDRTRIQFCGPDRCKCGRRGTEVVQDSYGSGRCRELPGSVSWEQP